MSKKNTVLLFVLLAFVLMARLLLLGHSTFRADTVEFYKYARVGHSIVELWTNPPWVNQIPFAEAVCLGFNKMFGLEATPFNVRLPFAIMGVLAVIFTFLFVREVLDERKALMVTALCALNPFHLYSSREAYHYVGVTLFSALVLWRFWIFWRALDKESVFKQRAFGFWIAASIAACHTHMSTWPIFGAQWLLIVWSILKRIEEPAVKKKLLLFVGGGLVLMGLVLFPWIRMVVEGFFESNAERRATTGWNVYFGVVAKLFPVYTFGSAWWGLALLGGVFIGGGLAIWKTGAWNERLKALLVLLGIEFVILSIVMAVMGGGQASANYFAPLWPIIMLLLVYVLNAMAAGLLPSRQVALAWGLTGAVLLYWVVPAWAIVTLDGKPKPYQKIVNWADENLPPQSLVLVDRWLEPWNELAMYPSTNVTFTFTVPDEPLENFLQLQWRERAKDFFRKHPTAAFMEITKNHWQHPAVGPWSWPRDYFAQHAVIKNQGGLVLRKWGLAPRGGFHSHHTNGLIVEVFYNTEEDLVARAASGGHRFVVWPGRGWGHTKLWQNQNLPMGIRFNDWRVMRDRAYLVVYNLSEQPAATALSLNGTAMNGAKRIWLNGQTADIAAGSVQQVTMGPYTLQPGRNELLLEDRNWNANRGIPLLLDQVAVVAVEEKGGKNR